MAEVVGAIALYQPVYHVIWTILSGAYTVCDGVRTRRKELRCLLDRCRDLLLELGKVLHRESVPTSMKENLEAVAR